MNFADTNWLEAMFFEADSTRRGTVERFLRKEKQPLGVSQIVILEARNVFARVSGEPEPKQWLKFKEDRRFYRDPMSWDLLQRDTCALIGRYGHKMTLGTFDLALLAAAKLGGATRLLTFDTTLGALAVAEGLEVFPPLNETGKALVAELRR